MYPYDKISNLDELETTLLELCYKGSGVTDKEFAKIDLPQIKLELDAGSFSFSSPKHLTLGGTKKRRYAAFGLPERIITQILYKTLNEICDPLFIDNLFSHRKNKSYKHAITTLQESMQVNLQGCVLRLDVERYYDSIDHEILISFIEKHVDPKTSNLLKQLIFNFGEEGRGIFSGNCLSNLFGNLYLSNIDHLVLENLGNKTYMRFVDDMAMICPSMAAAQDLRSTIEAYLDEKLKLRLSQRKSFVRPVSEGCTFLGYNIFPNKLFLLQEYIDSTNEQLDKIMCGKSGLSDEQIKNKIRSIKSKLKNTCETSLQNRVEAIEKILKTNKYAMPIITPTKNEYPFANVTTEPPKPNTNAEPPKPPEPFRQLQHTIVPQYLVASNDSNPAESRAANQSPTNELGSQIITEIRNINIINLTPWEAFLFIKKWNERVYNPELK
ncbi:MAG: reverse transcriptase/maturase family protein [Oscillospiraceae bacterium]|nr:reverse transcriptase/maturase family protein [Oscillospiraceae bacterium]